MTSTERITVLPLVKAYPALSRSYGEVSCVAGVQISPDPLRWVRLYPIPFRSLDDRQQFRKYQPISVDVQRHSSDTRPETLRPSRESISLVGDVVPSSDDWKARRRFVEPLMVESMCELRRRQAADGTSLGVFRPKEIKGLVFEPIDVDAGKAEIARNWAAQGSLLDGTGGSEKTQQIRALEMIPWRFKIAYACADHSCPGHEQSVIDWEIARTFQRVRGSADWQDRMRRRWIGELCSPLRDTAFFVGNQHQYPKGFLILGIWWPPKRQEQLTFS